MPRSCLMQTKRRDVGRKTHHFLRSSRAEQGATAGLLWQRSSSAAEAEVLKGSMVVLSAEREIQNFDF